jgi:hypothetical protein
MAEMPRATDLFGDASPREAAERHEEYLGELNKSLANSSSVPGQAPTRDPLAAMEALAATKSLTPDALAGLQQRVISTKSCYARDPKGYYSY